MNNFAISSKGIGDALYNSASSLAAGGNTLDESIGLIAAMNEVVQNPDEVGTALKTISMRLRNTSGQLQDMGEDATDTFDSITKIQQQIFKASGVDIFQEDGETFKSTFQIMNEFAANWGNMSDLEKADLTKIVGGVHQGNKFNALMTNMAKAVEATATAEDSAGSAAKENAVYLDSMEGRLTKLSSTFQGLSLNIINDGFAKWSISGIDKIIAGISKLAETFGGLPTIIGLGTLAMQKFTGALTPWKIFDDITTKTKVLKKQAENDTEALRKLNTALQETYTKAEKKAAKKGKSVIEQKKAGANAVLKVDASKYLTSDGDKNYKPSINTQRQAINLIDSYSKLTSETDKATEAQKKNNDEIDGFSKKANKGATFAGRLGSGMKNFGLSLLSSMGYMLAFTALLKIGEVAWKTFDENILHRAEHLKENLENTQADISNIQNQIAENQTKINQLKEKGNLSDEEQSTLFNLESQNKQLERQLELKTQIANLQNKEYNREIINEFKKGKGDYGDFKELKLTGRGSNKSLVWGNTDKYNDLSPSMQYVEYAKDRVKYQEELQADISKYTLLASEAESRINEAYAKGDKVAEKAATEDYNKYQKEIESKTSLIETALEDNIEIQQAITEAKSAYKAYLDDDSIPEATKQYYQQIYDQLELAEQLLNKQSFSGDLKNNLAELEVSAQKADKALAKLQKLNQDGTIKLDSANVIKFNDDASKGFTMTADIAEKELNKVIHALNQFRNKDGKINWDMEGAAEFRTVLDALYYKKQQLSAPMLLQIDVESSALTEDNKETLGLFQDWYNAANYVEYLIKIGADTSEIDAAKNDYNQIVDSLENDDLSDAFLIKLGIDIEEEFDGKSVEEQVALVRQKIEESIIAVDENGEVVVRPKVKVRPEWTTDTENSNDETKSLQNSVNDIITKYNEYQKIFLDTTATDVDKNDAYKKVTDLYDKLSQQDKDLLFNLGFNVEENEVTDFISWLNENGGKNGKITIDTETGNLALTDENGEITSVVKVDADTSQAETDIENNLNNKEVTVNVQPVGNAEQDNYNYKDYLGLSFNPLQLNTNDYQQVLNAYQDVVRVKEKIQNDNTIPIDVKTDKLEKVDNLLEQIINKRNELENNGGFENRTANFMNLEAGDFKDGSWYNERDLGYMKEMQGAVSNLKLGVDVEESQQKVNKLAEKIKELSADEKLKFNINPDTSTEEIIQMFKEGKVQVAVELIKEESVEKLFNYDGSTISLGQSNVFNTSPLPSTLTPQPEPIVKVKPEIDEAFANGLQLPPIEQPVNLTPTAESTMTGNLPTATQSVQFKPDTSTITKKISTPAKQPVSYSYDNAVPHTTISTPITQRVTYEYPDDDNPRGGAARGRSKANGTANVNGTAFKNGTWGTKNSGNALVGELGTELVVRNGKFFTIGDNGAEMFHYQKDDIIFNHVQTEQILKNGEITHGKKRGKLYGSALAEGTAFAWGKYDLSGNSNSSSNNSDGGSGSSKSSGGSSGNSKSSGGGSKSGNSSKSDTSKTSNEFEKERKKLDHQRKMDEISNKQYYAELTKLYEKYYKGKSEYQDAAWSVEEELYELEKDLYNERQENRKNEIYLLEKQVDATLRLRTKLNEDDNIASTTLNRYQIISEYQDIQKEAHEKAQYYREKFGDENHEMVQQCIKDWWEAEEAIEEIYQKMFDEFKDIAERDLNYQEQVISVASDILDDEIEKLEEKKKALEEANKEKEKENELEELRQKLENARKQKNVRVYYEDKGWVWESNQKDIEEAQKNLDDYLKEKEIDDIEKEIEKLQKYQDKIQEIPDEWQKTQDREEVLAKEGQDFVKRVLDGVNDDTEFLLNDLRKNYDKMAKSSKSWQNAQDKQTEYMAKATDVLQKFGFTAAEAIQLIGMAAGNIGLDNITDLDQLVEEATGKTKWSDGKYYAVDENGTRYVFNPTTGNFGMSTDGGKTWVYAEPGQDNYKQIQNGFKNAEAEAEKKYNVGNGNSTNTSNTSSNGTIYKKGGSGSEYAYNPSTGNIMVTRKDGSSQIYYKDGKNYSNALKAFQEDTGYNIKSSSGSSGGGNKGNSGSGGSSGGSTSGVSQADRDLKKAQEDYGKAKTDAERKAAIEAGKKARENGATDSGAEKVWKENKAATGTLFAKEGLYNVDELGSELVVKNPQKGRYTYLENGDGVIPADLTRNIWKWASTTPSALLRNINSLSKGFNVPQNNTTISEDNSTNIHIDKIVSNANNFEALLKDIKIKSKNR